MTPAIRRGRRSGDWSRPDPRVRPARRVLGLRQPGRRRRAGGGDAPALRVEGRRAEDAGGAAGWRSRLALRGPRGRGRGQSPGSHEVGGDRGDEEQHRRGVAEPLRLPQREAAGQPEEEASEVTLPAMPGKKMTIATWAARSSRWRASCGLRSASSLPAQPRIIRRPDGLVVQAKTARTAEPPSAVIRRDERRSGSCRSALEHQCERPNHGHVHQMWRSLRARGHPEHAVPLARRDERAEEGAGLDASRRTPGE